MRTLAPKKDKQELVELIKYEGVDCKGFGTIAKLVTTDTDLSIGAKALYAYLCSYCGNGMTAFPRRNKIMADLCIVEETYYRYFNELKESGYIKAERGKTYPFANTYTIISRPPKLKNAKTEEIEGENKLYVRGIKSLGYGTVPKAVMQDRRLHFKAKALYAYICSFAGNGNTAFPSRATILHHLQITINPFQRYIKQLIEYNYIDVEQTKKSGRFANNIYYLNDLPDEEEGKKAIERRNEIQDKKVQKNKKQAVSETENIKGVNIDTPLEDSALQEEKAENSSAFKGVSSKRTTPVPTYTKYDDLEEQKKVEAAKMVLERESYEEYIKANIDYDILEDSFSTDSVSKSLLDNIMSIILDTVTSKAPFIRIKGQEFPQEVVKSKLLKLTYERIEYVIDNLKNVTTEIKNLPQYILACLYNADIEDFYWHNQVKKDGII